VARGHYQSTTVGVNWYWNRYVRWMFDWIHPWNSAATVFGDTQADILAVRFQIAY
jgi:phosphate-selective porin